MASEGKPFSIRLTAERRAHCEARGGSVNKFLNDLIDGDIVREKGESEPAGEGPDDDPAWVEQTLQGLAANKERIGARAESSESEPVDLPPLADNTVLVRDDGRVPTLRSLPPIFQGGEDVSPRFKRKYVEPVVRPARVSPDSQLPEGETDGPF
jgi:hypothetical protein